MVSATAGTHREHFIALDSLRGIAAIVVVLFHMGEFGWLAGLPAVRAGWLLVDFFFILSGFVIAMSYGARLAQGYPKGRFLLLRAWRVLPLHYMVLAIMLALQLALFGPVLREPHAWIEFWRSMFLLDAFRPHTGNWFTPVSWTLAVEMVLYLLTAVLFGRGRWGMALALLGAGTAAWFLWSGINPPVFGSLLQRGVLGFVLGVAAYGVHRRLARIGAGFAGLTLAELATLAGIVVLLSLVPQRHSSVLLVDMLFVVAVLVFARDGGAASRFLQAPWAVWLGRWSFAIYMTHLFAIIALNRGLPILFDAVGRPDLIVPGRPGFGLTSVELGQGAETLLTLAVLPVVLAMGWAAWRYVEEPVRQWSRAHVGRAQN